MLSMAVSHEGKALQQTKKPIEDGIVTERRVISRFAVGHARFIERDNAAFGLVTVPDFDSNNIDTKRESRGAQ